MSFIPFVEPVLLFLVLGLPSLCGAEPVSDCGRVLELSSAIGSQARAARFAAFPEVGQREFRRLVDDVRAQLARTGTYAIVDLNSYMPRQMGKLWFKEYPKKEASLLHNGEIIFEKDGKVVVRRPVWQTQEISRLRNFMQDVIRVATGEVVPFLPGWGSSQVRTFPAGIAGGVRADQWHVDGGYASVTVSLLGAGTEVLGPAPLGWSTPDYHDLDGVGKKWESQCKGCEPITLGTGKALILFGSKAGAENLYHPTIHRTPRFSDERLLIVLRY